MHTIRRSTSQLQWRHAIPFANIRDVIPNREAQLRHETHAITALAIVAVCTIECIRIHTVREPNDSLQHAATTGATRKFGIVFSVGVEILFLTKPGDIRAGDDVVWGGGCGITGDDTEILRDVDFGTFFLEVIVGDKALGRDGYMGVAVDMIENGNPVD